MEAEWKDINKLRFTALAATACLFESLLTHPLWVIKTIEQVECVPQSTRFFAQQRRLIGQVYGSTGIVAFYRGFWFGNASTIPTMLAYYLMYHKAKDMLTGSYMPQCVRVTAPFFAGMLAELATLPIWVPCDVLSQRLLLPEAKGKGTFAVASRILQEEGFRAFYKGAAITSVELALSSGVYWFVYEHTKLRCYEFNGTDRLDDHWKVAPMLAGVVSGTACSAATIPLDVVKTRMQCEKTVGVPGSPGPVYSSVMSAIGHIWRKEGMRGFTRGWLPRVVGKGPIHAIGSLIYELVVEASLVPAE